MKRITAIIALCLHGAFALAQTPAPTAADDGIDATTLNDAISNAPTLDAPSIGREQPSADARAPMPAADAPPPFDAEAPPELSDAQAPSAFDPPLEPLVLDEAPLLDSDGEDGAASANALAIDDTTSPPLDLDVIDARDVGVPERPRLGPAPESWAAWRRGIEARLDDQALASVGRRLDATAPAFLQPGVSTGQTNARVDDFFAGRAPPPPPDLPPPLIPANQAPSLLTPERILRPPPGSDGVDTDALEGFFAGFDRPSAAPPMPAPRRSPPPIAVPRPPPPADIAAPVSPRPAGPRTSDRLDDFFNPG